MVIAMSRIGKMPVTVPSGVEVTLNGQDLSIKGPKGTLTHNFPELIKAVKEDSSIVISRANDERLAKSLHGLSRTLVANMITGVTQGYSNKDLEFALGYSHPVAFPAPAGITFTVESPTELVVGGVDKQLVGETVAKIQKLRKSDPYKGKGLHLLGERIRRKAGKTGKKA
jgi:large subunit ribosomal protein L6